MNLLVTIVVVVTTSYTLAAFLRSRRRHVISHLPPKDLFFVFLVPCLNEAMVIGRTLERLLELKSGEFAVLVIDDASDDETAEIVRSYDPEHVWLLQRQFPNARTGKGHALNDAYRYVRDSGVLGDRRHDDVIIAVFDADGRVAENALFEVTSYFGDSKSGAVQIGVRMYNRDSGLLARMQDLEFVTFTEIFQRARQRLGSVGLGGNGQFARLTALETLGDSPWSDCLTEDLELGVRLTLNGWTNNFCATSHVSQQAVVSVRRLIRQRARWFQGHLQCWKLIPSVLRDTKLSVKQSNDLLYHLSSPALVLVMSVPVIIFVVAMTAAVIHDPSALLAQLLKGKGTPLVVMYLLSFGLAPFYAFAYWQKDQKIRLWRAMVYAHVFSLYGYLWLPAGWIATWKVLRRQRGWAKTSRTADATEVEKDASVDLASP